MIWGQQHPDTQAALADLRRRVEALEARPYAVPGEVVQLEAQECCGRGPACGACDPEPVPEWRRLVDGTRCATASDPLASVLLNLGRIQMYGADESHTLRLAQIIAVCEAQVGNGWQADPDEDPIDHRHVDVLIHALATVHRWKRVGNRAAAWLCDLTEDRGRRATAGVRSAGADVHDG